MYTLNQEHSALKHGENKDVVAAHWCSELQFTVRWLRTEHHHKTFKTFMPKEAGI